MLTKVMNLLTGQEQFFTLPPADAVIAAHAQSKGDFNTQDYKQRYGGHLAHGRRTVACGNFAALLEAGPNKETL